MADTLLRTDPSNAQSTAASAAVFRCDGEYWTVGYQGAVLHLRDCKGLRYLNQLLHRPDERFSALELIALVAGGATSTTVVSPGEAERARSAVTKRIRAAIGRIQIIHERLGRHLTATVKTGQYCVYSPDPGQAVRWT